MTQSTLETYKEKREFWNQCLCGSDPNSVLNQLYQTVWDTAAYKAINEARRVAHPAEEGGVELNPLVHRLIDGCFFVKQLMAIRKLTDTYPLTGRRGVISLVSLLNDMKDNVVIMTRNNIFLAEGLE